MRASLAELVEGLDALHAHELAHCDVKLENVLVEPSGRVVLLDCGLATRWCEAGARVRGTRAYLAPETLEGRVGPEADLFAVGVILQAALTGRPPRVSASPLEPDRSFAPSSHDESPLGVLCRRLLSRDPTERPRAAEILETLRRGPRSVSPVLVDEHQGRETFVGRSESLALLDEALEMSANGGVSVVWVEGDSGIGKSALLERFRRRIERRPNAVVLFGRARHGDAVPFPALDEAIDDLASYLSRLPRPLADVVLPRRLARVARVFPSLAGAPAIARTLPMPDPLEAPETTRRLAFDGLREVFARLADSREVVLILDDLQWIDADSRALLVHLLDGDDAPRMLVLAALRPADEGPEAKKLEAALGARVRRVVLGPLSHDESCALVRARWRAGGTPEPIVAARLAEEARGVPVFLELLASTASTGVVSPLGARLDDVVRSQMRVLSQGARRALEVVCVASRPLPVSAVLVAAGLLDAIELDSLRTTPLARATPADGGWVLEPYHDRIRDAVRATLSPEVTRDHHGRLAAALAADSARHPELLVEHLAASGARDEATALAIGAARAANEQFAFDRAAVLIAIALDLGHFSDEERVALLRERAGVLQLARRRRECGEARLAASTHARNSEASSLRREAGVHLLYSGDVRRGLEALEPALAEAGLRVPASFAETVAVTQTTLGAIAARGLVPAAPVVDPADAEARVDLCLILAQGLAHIDLRVLPFACQGFLAALDLGDPGRLQRAAALFVINTVEYLPNPLARPALELCGRLTPPDATPYARASYDAAVAENAHFEGDFFGAEAAFERAEWTLLDGCPEATRELAMVRDLAVFVQYAQKGDFKSQLERTQRWQAEADVAQDIYHASMLRVAHAIVWIANDEPLRARAELDRAQREWLGEASVLEVGAALYYDIIDRYEERDLAPALPAETRASLLRSPAAATPFLGGYIGLQRAWTLLRAIAFGNAAPSAPATVGEIVAGLRAGGLPIWAAVADALEANLDFLGGARQRALAGLDRAETRFRRMGMSCLAACARRRRGELGEGELGARLRGEADAELTDLGVADVARWTRAYWSMFDADDARARTNPGFDTDGLEAAPVTRMEDPIS